jgi:NAD(P)-dependent dehydrogenase (short-subunit alcohol dehydrogenase family)
MRLAEKVAVITGAGSGIGQAIAERFAQEGALVIINDIDSHRAEHTAQRVKQWAPGSRRIVADVTNPDAVASMAYEVIRQFGRIDILVNNVGASFGDDILTLDHVTWNRNIQIVLTSAYLCSKAFLPTMINQRSGCIINISSVNGLTGLGEEAYSAAKAGLNNLTLNLAVRYGRFGVRVNAICPGTVRTPIWHERLAKDPDIFTKLGKWYPLGRVGEPQDIANAALFLASDEAAWITGVILPVDGGLTAGNYYLARALQGEAEQ